MKNSLNIMFYCVFFVFFGGGGGGKEVGAHLRLGT